MSALLYTHLPNRRIFRIAGEDRASFLQGLITNDIRKVDAGEIIFAAMLTPQGKFFADFFIHPREESYLLEVDEILADTLIKKLSMYKLRAKVTVEPCEELHVIALWGSDTPPTLPHLFTDPRYPAMGWRMISDFPEIEGAEKSSIEAYDTHRLILGIPDGAKDATDRSLILDLGYEPLNAVDYQKGCYVGQEVTARMHYRDVKRKGIMKVEATAGATLPEKGSEITAGESTVGEITSSRGAIGLAMVKFDALEKAQSQNIPLQTKTGEVTITLPVWK